MKSNLDRYRRDAYDRGASNADTERLIAASQRLAAEVSRMMGPELSIADRHYWLETMMNHIPDFIYAKDTQGRFMIANQATVTQNGFTHLHEMLGKSDFDFLSREHATRFAQDERRIVETGEPMFGIEELNVASKVERWLLTSKVPLRNKRGDIIGIVGVSRDITDRKRTERLMVAQARLLELIAKSTPLPEFFHELILMIEGHLPDILGSIMMLSADGQRLLPGVAPSLDPAYTDSILNANIGPKVGPCGLAAWRGETVIIADILSDPDWRDYADIIRPYGYRSVWSTPVRSYQGQVLGTFALYSMTVRTPNADHNELISMAAHLAGIAIERQQAQERIQFMAHHDVLTGLPNRVLFDEQVGRALRQARGSGQRMALAFLDLDNFKLINDTLGHHAGDELLCVVAERMLACVRKSDMVVRVGGDEFIILLTELPSGRCNVASRMEDIRAAIGAPLILAGRCLQVSCSMGVVCYPDHGETPTELLANADSAMYRAKEAGRNNLQLFNAEMAHKARERLRQHEELRDAVLRNEFVLHYQPQSNLRSGRIFAAESLVRWQHPTRGLVSPGDFISLAEETGLIVPIGDWVLSEACRQNKAWQKAGLTPIVISVNVSARQFKELNWVSRVAKVLEESGLDPRYLELELTESLIMQDVAAAIDTMHQLQALGIHLAIDDFGTGYSSLSALKSFPVRRLKIDRSFVTEIPSNEEDKAITGAIISLAQKLGMQVIAEGVETQAQIDFLKDSGCDDIQGYVVSRPIDAASFAALIESETARVDEAADL